MINKRKKSMSQNHKLANWTFLVVLSLSVCLPPILDGVKIVQVLNLAIIVILLIIIFKKSPDWLFITDKISAIYIICFLIFILSMLLPDYLQGDIHGGRILFSARLTLFAAILMKFPKRPLLSFFKTLALYLNSLVILNFLCLVFLKNGIITPYGVHWQRQDILLNANSYAFYYIFTFCITLLAFQKGKRPNPLVCGLLLIEYISLQILAPKSSDTGILIVIGMILYYASRCWLGDYNPRPMAIAAVSAVVIAMVLLLVLHNGSWLSSALAGLGIDTNTLLNRMEIWQDAATKIFKRGIVFGSGTGVESFAIGDGGLDRSAHNEYLQILYYGGLFAFIPFLALVFSPIILNPQKRSFAFWNTAAAGIVFYLILFFVEQKVFFEGPLYLVLLMAVKFAPSEQPVEQSLEDENAAPKMSGIDASNRDRQHNSNIEGAK